MWIAVYYVNTRTAQMVEKERRFAATYKKEEVQRLMAKHFDYIRSNGLNPYPAYDLVKEAA
jgi:hypothetical protein